MGDDILPRDFKFSSVPSGLFQNDPIPESGEELRKGKQDPRLGGDHEFRTSFFGIRKDLFRQSDRIDLPHLHPTPRKKGGIGDPFRFFQRIKSRILPFDRSGTDEEDVKSFPPNSSRSCWEKAATANFVIG